MRFSGPLRGKVLWEQGKWHHIPGRLDSGKHFLPPQIQEAQRKELIGKLWREARNEMWLVRNKHKDASLDGPTRPTLEVESSAPVDLDYESRRLRNEMALLPDVTFEDRFMHIAKEGHEWDRPHKMDKKYPDLRKHLSAKINTKNAIFRYPKPVERPLTWTSIKGFDKP